MLKRKTNNMKRLFLLASFFTLLIACSKESEIVEDPTFSLISPQEIDKIIISSMQGGSIWNWESASDDMLYSALMHSDSIISIGYEVSGMDVEHTVGTELWSKDKMIEKRDRLLQEILDNERSVRKNSGLQLEDILPFGTEEDLPTISVQLTDKNILEDLRKREDIRYVEPLGYYLQTVTESRSSSGCTGSPDYGINNDDYETVDPGTKVPWNFYTNSIDDAWGCSQGDNIGICIIDTGVSDDQDNLGIQFSSGYSSGRYIQKYSTLYSGAWWWKTLDTPHDQCGHGTSMAGLAAAPRGTDGNAMGAAYKSNIISVRAVADVLISSSNEKNGVKNALKLAGDRSDVQIISMSIGSPFSIGKVKDGVYYAYNRGKLIMAAAGTSTSVTNWYGVIFPASMSQCTAITGVKEQAELDRCNTCHSGSQVEFVMTMQRSYDNDRNSLALASFSNQPKYISGSSAATATAAGVAAMVWSTNPSMNRSAVLNQLKVTAQLYPDKDSQYGYGNINALSAVNCN